MNRNQFINALLTDTYQFTATYAYWKVGRHEEEATFDLFFRKNPFKGEFTIFAGLDEVLRFVENYKITKEQIRFLREGFIASQEELVAEFNEGLRCGWIREVAGGGYERIGYDKGGDYWHSVSYPTASKFIEPPLADCEPEFYEWLEKVNCSQLKIYAIPEGTLVFPRVPLIRVDGPLAIGQLIETTALNLINFPSLAATNGARYRLAAGPKVRLLEFGLRRAQGPDGAMSATKYIYMGGFDGTSNVLGGMENGITPSGTNMHAFISSFTSLKKIKRRMLKDASGIERDFMKEVLEIKDMLSAHDPAYKNTNEGELAGMIAYAMAWPKKFLTLVDTLDTLKSGVPNFICVAIALKRFGYDPVGIRLDSGDLGYFSREARKMFQWASGKSGYNIHDCIIAASNDIDEEVILSLNNQGHEINTMGVGTKVVTCSNQSALGCVYKLVVIEGESRIKLSNDFIKITLPGRKEAYRLYVQGKDFPVMDILIEVGEEIPQVGKRILCRHPFDEVKRVYVTPTKVVKLHYLVWDGQRRYPVIPLEEMREYVLDQIANFREDHLRLINPTPYKVSVSEALYDVIHELWAKESPIEEL